MKKIASIFLLLISIISFSACNEKLNIAAPYKNITVVYGLLNQSDTAHYIRIQKAFMDENQSAFDMAKVADSSFYKALNVSVKEISPAGLLLNTISLVRVDLTNENMPKDSGAFYNTPSYAYKFKYSLNKLNTYRLIILNTETGNVDSSETPIIDNSGPVTTFGVREWLNAAQTISFAKEYSESGKIEELNYSVSIPPNVGVAELVLRFRWLDSNIVTGATTSKYADFNQFAQKSGTEFTPQQINQTFEVITQNKNIFDFLSNAVGPTNPDVYHYFGDCDMFLYVAGVEYRRYRDLNTTKGGLTADEIRPVYTNIKGQNVMGLFNTRTFTQRLQMKLAQDTKDSILVNAQTRGRHIMFQP